MKLTTLIQTCNLELPESFLASIRLILYALVQELRH